ncbi:glycosyltransferase family 2 protein [bacterium]|nr:glycosyltransferase family 2 protein [bacterium]
MIISAVIPTKNRPHDLLQAVRSILSQKRLPDQLIIIDQSNCNYGKSLIDLEFVIKLGCDLCYINDTNIKGLVEAKAKSLEYVKGDIICFFEDDIIIEHEYIFEIERAFKENIGLKGCSGVITNATSSSKIYRFFYNIFHRGIFTDPRPDIYANFLTNNNQLIKSNVINGGLSAWRRDVFEEVEFDYYNKFHMMEDFEFSFRVNHRFPDTLFINPNARLVHNYSQLNRDSKIRSLERKLFEYIVFYKKNRQYSNSTLSLFIVLLGIFFNATGLCLKHINLAPILAFFRGTKNGFKYEVVKI